MSKQGVSPEDKSGKLSYVTFSWLTPLFKIGKERTLEHSDMYPICEQDKADRISQIFNENWVEETEIKAAKGKSPTLVHTIWHYVRFRFFIAGIFKLIHDIAQYAVPVCLSYILDYVEDEKYDEWKGIKKGYWYCFALFCCQIIQFFFVNQYFHIMFRLGMHVRIGIISLIYKRSLSISSSSKQQSSTGKIVNLMSNDATRLDALFRFVQNIWSSPFQIIVGFTLLFIFLGWSALSGILVMAVMSPLQGKLTKHLIKQRKKVIGFTDGRVKIANEMLTGIRVIKYYAWEKPFGKQVADRRKREVMQYSKYVIFQSLNHMVWRSSSVLVTLVTFSVHASFGGDMDVSTIFTAISLFSRIRFPMSMLPMIINNLNEAFVAARRIASFLNMDRSAVLERSLPEGEKASVKIKNASFTWEPSNVATPDGSKKNTKKTKKESEAPVAESTTEESDSFGFENIDFEAGNNELVAVVGAVGCGKSSLISALLGEMEKTGGELKVSGSMAYVPQQAWIIHDTVRNNILFGEEYDENRYLTALKVAQLKSDLDLLPAGDETEIGERGINLSGGQKQRVSLARAIYANKDIYVFDDPLSALDAHVGRAVFEQLINNHLKNKLVVLVTHQLQFLTQCDRIYVLKDGGIDSEGTFQELMIADGELRRLCDEHGIDVNETLRKTDETEITTIDAASGDESVDESEVVLESKSEDKIENKSDKEKGKEKGKGKNKKGKLVQKEERGRGSVKKSTYISYFRMFWRWKGAFILFAIYILLNGLSRVSPDFFLTYWSTNEDEHSVEFFLMIFAILNIVYVFMQFGLTWMFMVGSLNASTRLHDGLLASILRAPVKFFDVTPVGRVLNRFTKDVDLADQSLRETMHTFVVTLVQIITSVSIIMLITRGLFLVPIILLSYIYATIMQYYRCSCRELKRLDSVSKSPIFSNFSETLGGLTTIRAFSKEEHVIRQNHKRLDYNCTAMFLRLAANRWLSLRLESLGAVLTLSTSSLLVFLRSQTSVSAGLVGFALVYTIQLMTFLSWMVRQVADTEAQMNAVERLKEYQNDEFEHEAPAIMDNDKKIVKEDKWISDGKVEFEDYSMRYRPELDLVLKNVSMKIPGKSKVGICGRTGSGKSSLMVALFRMTEASGGKIIIDDEDISKIGLETLRSSLAIIPQDPVLFVGSVRMNLDPFNNFSDDELWEALRRCHMKDVILSRNNALDADVTEGGENFSVGERQLLCLGRALLRHAKVIVMDEATASVDFDTDSVIQETVRKEFSDSTVLTIAHRLPTIIDYDLILVMDDGKVAEFDKPKNLVSSGGIFSQLIDELGPAMAASMREQAQ
eukprot:TRINITY_DN1275_c0_g1_i10.p1 TRINITY_DN1275_c0_g1~~TRINITY_DN1275_c0_g1_i10.p1  ORF type:complete len:1325 (+),score=521.20 TRINITY_DN1275_c0_g1_i10:63-4037(+)